MKSVHALVTLVVGVSVGIVWLTTFWRHPRRVPLAVLLTPAAVAILGLGHWVAYDFSLRHWAGDFSLLQAVFNIAVAIALFARRGDPPNVTLRHT